MRENLDAGKYTVIFDEKTGELYALRYGEKWRDLSGDNLIYYMLCEIEELRNKLTSTMKKPQIIE